MSNIQDLDLLRCPHCAPNDAGELTEVRDSWLSCSDCHRNYPVVQGIPVLLPEEGDRWIDNKPEQLPIIEEHNRFASAS